MRDMVKAMAVALEVKGLMNVQLAWQDDQIYVIEVNPRASRTVPFVSKAIGYHWPRSLRVVWRDSHLLARIHCRSCSQLLQRERSSTAV